MEQQTEQGISYLSANPLHIYKVQQLVEKVESNFLSRWFSWLISHVAQLFCYIAAVLLVFAGGMVFLWLVSNKASDDLIAMDLLVMALSALVWWLMASYSRRMRAMNATLHEVETELKEILMDMKEG